MNTIVRWTNGGRSSSSYSPSSFEKPSYLLRLSQESNKSYGHASYQGVSFIRKPNSLWVYFSKGLCTGKNSCSKWSNRRNNRLQPNFTITGHQGHADTSSPLSFLSPSPAVNRRMLNFGNFASSGTWNSPILPARSPNPWMSSPSDRSFDRGTLFLRDPPTSLTTISAYCTGLQLALVGALGGWCVGDAWWFRGRPARRFQPWSSLWGRTVRRFRRRSSHLQSVGKEPCQRR